MQTCLMELEAEGTVKGFGGQAWPQTQCPHAQAGRRRAWHLRLLCFRVLLCETEVRIVVLPGVPVRTNKNGCEGSARSWAHREAPPWDMSTREVRGEGCPRSTRGHWLRWAERAASPLVPYGRSGPTLTGGGEAADCTCPMREWAASLAHLGLLREVIPGFP